MSKNLRERFNILAAPPAGWRESYFRNNDGQNIRYGYAPSTDTKKGTILLTHGYGESTDIYFETIKEYQKRGYDIWAMDWAGMGKSDSDSPHAKKRPAPKDFSRHVYDMDTFINTVVKRDASKPFLMSTHSFGGHIGLLYLEKHKKTFDGAIMSAPMFDLTRAGLPPLFRKPIRFLFNVLSKAGLKDTPIPTTYQLLGRADNKDENIVDIKINKKTPESLRADWKQLSRKWNPDTELERPTFGWVAVAYDTIETSLMPDSLKEIETPILIGSAGYEDLVDNRAHKKVANTLGDKATLVKIEDANHNLFHDTDKVHKEWWNHISSFLKKTEGTNPLISVKKAANDGKNFPNRKQA